MIGGAAGTGYVLSTRGKEVRIGKGADLAVKLTAPLTVRFDLGFRLWALGVGNWALGVGSWAAS